MSMDNYFTKVLFTKQKILPYPKHVLLPLFFQCDTRSDACVDKKVVAADKRKFQIIQKPPVARRQSLVKSDRQFGLHSLVDVRRKSIRHQSFQTAKALPVVKRGRLGHKIN